MRANKTNKLFFSVFRTENLERVNQMNHRDVIDHLASHNYIPVVLKGVYQGIQEDSILLETTDYSKFERMQVHVLELASKYHQESVLRVHNDDTAELLLVGTKGNILEILKLGKLVEVSSIEVLKLSSYSYNPETDKYYAIKEHSL